MFSENVWTRVRKLEDEKSALFAQLMLKKSAIFRAIQDGEWDDAKRAAQEVVHFSDRMREVESELELIGPLVDGFDRICKRMEQLEEEARKQGWEDKHGTNS